MNYLTHSLISLSAISLSIKESMIDHLVIVKSETKSKVQYLLLGSSRSILSIW